MFKSTRSILLVCLLVFFCQLSIAQGKVSFDKYHTPAEVQQFMKQLQQSNPEKVKLHQIATSPGGEPVSILEIGKSVTAVPGIFVGANFEGNVPLATEGALRLAQMLLDSAQYSTSQKWYILPLPNPDAAKGYF